ncbi:hypothetical protein N7474_000148 [Penicillium riverlandense]|uniref:uncharacterized protein n=1 Tax=Penicillium riverlandense TaxID=1903569 RepID=UPI0025495FCD|nr:uncharacterized protein N7474_000148 [Penicillium riverlandense]KAJ5831837.1 hypothetical protein N7474_000148 [Penicillium riverlandense]
MALAARIGALTDELIAATAKITADQKDSTRVKNLKRRVEASFHTGNHGRTDQFAVAKQLEGLQEKFQVLNRDELADALRIRLSELDNYKASWAPEILSLFLQLSNRPAVFSKVDWLKTSANPIEEPESLSWSDLNAQGLAYSSEDIWEEVDFAADSSDDGFSSISSGMSSPRTVPQTSHALEKGYVVPDEVFVPVEEEDLVASIEKVQFWKAENHSPNPKGKEDASRTITELQLAREIVFMLQGLPTSIFWRLDGDIEIDRSYALAHSSDKSLSSLLRSFSEIGAKMDVVRHFTKLPQTVPYVQTFCRGIEERLLEFDKSLSQIQCQYVTPGSVVSLLQLLDDVRRHSRQLGLLADLVSCLGEDAANHPMRCLDLLYDLICMLEALGDDNALPALAELFYACFKTYMRSIQAWMESGHIDPADCTFFIRKNSANADLRSLWNDWYTIDEGPQGQNIPRLLEISIQKVFTTGKTMVFLRHLNAPQEESLDKYAITLENVLPSHSSSLLALPFSALVQSALEKLVDANHSVSAGFLRKELDEQCGLWASLDALQHVYLGKDLSVLSMIDAKVFELIDRGRSWNDKLLLTEVTRTAFSAVGVIDPSRLVVRPTGGSSHSRQGHDRTVKILETISIDYILPWPVANIIAEDAIHSYQRISVFLMQIRRAKYAIVKQRLRNARNITESDENDTLAHALHHNLLWFLDFLYGHITYLVISSAAQSLYSALSSAEDVDAMIAAHKVYMSSLEDQCLISENLSPIHDAIINLLDLCVRFADLQTVHSWDAQDRMVEESHIGISKAYRRTRDPEDEDVDSDSDEDIDHEQTLMVSVRDSPYDYQLRTVQGQFEHLVSFIADGLKGVARADGQPSWDILADRLEWRKSLAKF